MDRGIAHRYVLMFRFDIPFCCHPLPPLFFLYTLYRIVRRGISFTIALFYLTIRSLVKCSRRWNPSDGISMMIGERFSNICCRSVTHSERARRIHRRRILMEFFSEDPWYRFIIRTSRLSGFCSRARKFKSEVLIRGRVF